MYIDDLDWDDATEVLYEDHLERFGAHPGEDHRPVHELREELLELQRMLVANDHYPHPRSHEDEMEAEALREDITRLEEKIASAP